MEVVALTKVVLTGGPNEGDFFVNEIEPPKWFFIAQTWVGGPWFGTDEDPWCHQRNQRGKTQLTEILGKDYPLWTGSPYTRYHIYRLDDAFTARYDGWTTVIKDVLDNF